MKCIVAACTALLMASTAALATVVTTLSGDRGFGTVEVRDADVYLADDTFRVLVEQTRVGANIGVIVRGSPRGATWYGGSVVGMGVNRTESWNQIYNVLPGPGNGVCFDIRNSPGMTIERLHCNWAWDGFRPDRAGNDDWTLRLAWINNNRDDGVENDQCNDGRIERSLIENSFVGYSARSGEGEPCVHDLEIVDNLISLGRYYEDLEKRFRPWSNVEDGRVMQSAMLFKVAFKGRGTRILLKDNIIKLDHTPGVAISELPIVPEEWEIRPNSGNNILVWLGANDLPGLTYEEINGCKVPKEFKVPQNLFQVVCGTEGEQLWASARAARLAEIEPPDRIIQFLGDLSNQIDVQRGMIEKFLEQRSEPEG